VSNPLCLIVVLQVVVELGSEEGVGDRGLWVGGRRLFGSSTPATPAASAAAARSGSPILITGGGHIRDLVEQSFTEAEQQVVVRRVSGDLEKLFAPGFFLSGRSPSRSRGNAFPTLDRLGASRRFPSGKWLTSRNFSP
jgi:hypothetical protein